MGSQVKFDSGKYGFTIFADFTFVNGPWSQKKPKICMANAKMKKVTTYVASKISMDKTHVFKNANSMSIFKITFFREGK